LKVELAAPDCGEDGSSNCSIGSHDLLIIKPNLSKLANQILGNILPELAAASIVGPFPPLQGHGNGLNCRYSRPVPSVYIKTYGCQMNERDSEAVAAQLVAKGYTLAPSETAADVILLNTCSVRDLAEQKALRKMENLAADVRRDRPKVVLGFMGCMAQSRGQELIDRLPDVDLVLGTQKFHRAADCLDEILAGRAEKIVDVAEEQGSEATIREHLLYGNGARNGDGYRPPLPVTAFVSIMQGCNQYCTFCIVPYTRGEERSRTISDIVGECHQLVAQGVKEITLLGQIVTSYGRRWSSSFSLPGERENPDTLKRELQHKSAFVQLLDAVHEIEGLERIRFTSPHPKGYGDDLIEAYGRLPKLVESAHLPVQSGSNRVLKLMHRGYTRERYVGIINKLRAAKPEIGVSTDFIVGFPGETEEDFEQTLLLAREVEFDQAYIFKYSQRRDTPAAAMPDQVPQEIREERNQRLLAVINEIATRKYSTLVGRQMQILAEGPSKKNPARMTGRTRCNRIVVFDGSERHRGRLMDVKITRAGSFTLYGDPAIVNL
jgi:tRNA-2-methylthio-N6-dimethylallyladenosine synthase